MVAIIESFNPYNHPLSCMHGSVDLLNIVRAIDSPNVEILWDYFHFHLQRSEGNLIDNFHKAVEQIRYAQIADSPDRGAPGTVEINYPGVLAAARNAGYEGSFGLEIFPEAGAEDAALAAVLRLALDMVEDSQDKSKRPKRLVPTFDVLSLHLMGCVQVRSVGFACPDFVDLFEG